MNVDGVSTTTPSNELYDEHSGLREAVAALITWFVAFMLALSVCALVGCRSSKATASERVKVTQLASAQVDARRSVLLASNLPLSLPVDLPAIAPRSSGDHAPRQLAPSWVLAVEEGTTQMAERAQHAQHWEQERTPSPSRFRLIDCVLMMATFVCGLFAVIWYRRSRP